MVCVGLVVCVCGLLCVYMRVCVCWVTPSTSSSSARANTWLSSFRIFLAICRSKFSWLPWHWHWHFACPLLLHFSSSLSVCYALSSFSVFLFSTPPSSHTSVAPHDSDFWHFTRAYFLPSFFISLDCIFVSFSRLGGKGQHSFCIDKPSTYLPLRNGLSQLLPSGRFTLN